MSARINLVGQKYGRLSVISRESNIGRWSAWLCYCECGKSLTVKTISLRSGNTKSCGCFRAETASTRFRKHGLKNSAEYKIWSLMRDRCNNPNNPKYEYYGGKGVTVCKRWDDFACFLADMGKRPTEGHTIDRKDGKLNYCPENCRWSTRKEQARNRSNTVMLTVEGIEKPLAEWAEIKNIPYDILKKRIWRGWDTERAINQDYRR